VEFQHAQYHKMRKGQIDNVIKTEPTVMAVAEIYRVCNDHHRPFGVVTVVPAARFPTQATSSLKLPPWSEQYAMDFIPRSSSRLIASLMTLGSNSLRWRTICICIGQLRRQTDPSADAVARLFDVLARDID
jgi:hypothetical protein